MQGADTEKLGYHESSPYEASENIKKQYLPTTNLEQSLAPEEHFNKYSTGKDRTLALCTQLWRNKLSDGIGGD